MKKLINIAAALSVLCFSIGLSAQNLLVKGTVRDSLTGEPIPFASIRLKGTMTGGNTDADGLYQLDVPVTTTCAVPCSMLFLYSVVKSTPSTKAISKNLPLTSGSTALPV